MTIALGVMGGRGIVITADSEEARGENKVFISKTTSSVSLSMEPPTYAIAITGAGHSWYIETIAQEIRRFHQLNETASLLEIEEGLKMILDEFYIKHVIPFHDDKLDFQLVIGVNHRRGNRLWATANNALRSAYCREAVGIGDVEANRLLEGLRIETFPDAIIAACCAIYEAKERVAGCGKLTTVECLYGNYAHFSIPVEVQEIEGWYQKYLRASHLCFSFSLGNRLLFAEEEELGKINEWHRALRKEAQDIAARLQHGLDDYVSSMLSVSQTLADQP